jgi:hypothetical protein
LSVSNLHGQPKDIFEACGFDQIVLVQEESVALVASIAA